MMFLERSRGGNGRRAPQWRRLLAGCGALVLVTLTPMAWAETFRIADIRVDGLQRVSPGSVFAALPVHVGDDVDSAELQDMTRALFKTGFFDDISISRDGTALVVKVAERPTIAELNISGNKAIKTEQLTEALKKAGLSEGEIFKPSTLEGLSGELERQYVAQGRYGAKVKTEVRELPRNRVALSIKVDEGKIAKIKHINIVGNKAFTTEELLKQFEQETSGWLSWMNSRDKYSREKLTGDLEKLKSFYMDRGYLRFNIESTQVALSPDKESIFITVNITEGDIYTVSGTDVAGELIVPEDELRSLIVLKDQQPFSQVLMTTSSQYMTQRLGNEGYTNSQVKGIPERNDDKHTVHVTFFVDPSHRAYVRRINFRGNTKTADEVLRREMRQMESASANSAKIEQSKTRLERLGYFKTVKVENTDVPGTGDQVDVDYAVEEQPSGSIGASVGFAQGSGIILGGNIQQDNFFGTGKQVGLNISTSSYSDQVSFNYVDPYYTVDGVSRGFNAYYSTRDLSKVNVASYAVDSYGLDMNFGYPMSEIERLGFSLGYNHTHIKVGMRPDEEISATPVPQDGVTSYVSAACAANPASAGCSTNSNVSSTNYVLDTTSVPASAFTNLSQKGFLDIYGDTFDNFMLSATWSRSTLNKARLATRGYSQSLTGEVSVPGVSDLEFWKMIHKTQYFLPLTENLTLRLHSRLGYGNGYGSTEGLPFFENFFSGGLGSVRGYRRNTLGPRSTPADNYYTVPAYLLDGTYGPAVYVMGKNGMLAHGNVYGSSSDPFGGNIVVEGGAEIVFPMPFVKDQSAMQPSVFLDAGNVFSDNCSSFNPTGIQNIDNRCSNINLGDLRYSTGVSLTWITGFGPLTFSLGKALNTESGDKKEIFQFSLGQTF